MIGRNNPFNIRNNRHNKWRGQVGSNNGFCNFDSLTSGVRAACIILMRSYRKFGFVTVEQIIKRFAPPSDNDTDNYILFVCNQTGFFRSTMMITDSDYMKLLFAMAKFEGNPVSHELISQTISLYNIVPLPYEFK